jgi:hypothetical protein
VNLSTRLNRLEKVSDDTRPWLVLDLSGTDRYTDEDIHRLKDETTRRSPGLRILILDGDQ